MIPPMRNAKEMDRAFAAVNASVDEAARALRALIPGPTLDQLAAIAESLRKLHLGSEPPPVRMRKHGGHRRSRRERRDIYNQRWQA